MDSFIYLIGASQKGPLKIGFTKRPAIRRRHLQTGNHQRLRVLYQCQHPRARIIEAELHRRFARQRLQGEWFKISLPEAVEAIRRETGEQQRDLLASAKRAQIAAELARALATRRYLSAVAAQAETEERELEMLKGALATLSTVPRERRDMPVVKTALSVVMAFQTSRLQRSMVLLPAVHGAPRPVVVAHANGN